MSAREYLYQEYVLYCRRDRSTPLSFRNWLREKRRKLQVELRKAKTMYKANQQAIDFDFLLGRENFHTNTKVPREVISQIDRFRNVARFAMQMLDGRI